MQDLKSGTDALQAELTVALVKLKFDDLLRQKQALDNQVLAPGFWDAPEAAQDVVKRQAKLERRVQPWLQLREHVADLVELVALDDPTMRADLEEQLREGQATLAALKDALKFSGPYDDYDCIMSIYAGAGGTDAQDWAHMLLRMYVRWCERQGVGVHTIEESAGDEAGLKSITLELSGDFVYGRLRGEHGVHRLVRLSPFNSDAKRQTSFAKVDILPKIDRPEDLHIDDKDLRIDVYRAGGHGGQSVNTTDSAVRITHLPTGLSVAIQNERSQLQNKEVAMTILRSRLIQMQIEQHLERLEELKGPNQSAEWGNQIRSYVLHPYKQVKDLRTRYETSDVDGVLGGELDELIAAYLDYTLGS